MYAIAAYCVQCLVAGCLGVRCRAAGFASRKRDAALRHPVVCFDVPNPPSPNLEDFQAVMNTTVA